jgi:UDP-N-acetylmuramyl tripeptide synthase
MGRAVAMIRPAYPSAPAGAPLRRDWRVIAARYAARAAAAASRRMRVGSGLVIGGRVLLVTGPRAASALCEGRRITLVSGTNGKTTTTALAAAAHEDGRVVGSNRDGANTSAGLAGTLATCEEQRLVLEVDEGWLPWAVTVTSPTAVVLTNLSRDQLSRHHEVGALAATWRRCLDGVALVVANVDDPHIVWPALGARAQVWVSVGERWTADSLVCPACGGHCRRDGQEWACGSCGLHRPHPDWWLDGATLCGPGARVPIVLDLPGQFNIGNAALALVAAHVTDGVPLEEAAGRLAEMRSVAGRFELIQFGAHELRVMLAKNPAGWLELIELMAPDRNPVVLLFNADGVDGRDPSWLYDVSFAELKGREVVVAGRRAADALVRLELDGVPARRVRGGVSDALADVPPGRVDVVGNYTAFRRALRELHHG